MHWCPNCKKDMKTEKKFHCIICAKCRTIVDYGEEQQRISVMIVE